MPNTPATEPTVLEKAMAEALATSNLVDRISRYDVLLAKYGVTAADFVQDLYPDELEFFLSSTPRQLHPAVKRWLGYRATRPSPSYLDRTRHLRHAWMERANAMKRQAVHPLSPREQFTLRLRTASLLDEGRVHWLNRDAPFVPVEDFVRWVSEEGIEWANALRSTAFLPAMHSWIEYFFVVFVQTNRLADGDVPVMAPGHHQSVFTRSKHFSDQAKQAAEVDLLDWIVPL